MSTKVQLTITGVDAKTSLADLPYDVEYGILYTASPEGRSRYPVRSKLLHIIRKLADRPLSLHVCGRKGKNQLLEYLLPDLTHGVQRIQVNGSVTPEELNKLCDLYGEHTVITQNSFFNRELASESYPNHAILVDGSGGNGVLPNSWARPCTEKDVGYAGGLGPSNIFEQVPLILSANSPWPRVWVDMESQVRTDDWLDVDKVWHVRREMQDYLFPRTNQ